MRTSSRSLIITILIIIALLLMALIGLLVYNIWQFQPPSNSATIYLVDSTIRMAEPLGEGSTTRLEAAQRFVSQSANGLPDSEVSSVHVFGSGASTIGCEDTIRLVPLARENQAAVSTKISEISPVSADAALVRAAIEALEELNDSGFTGKVQLIIVTGGDGTCNDDLELIVRAANGYGFELETIIVPVNSNRGGPGSITIPAILGAQEIPLESEESIAEIIDLINSDATPVVLVVGTDTPTAPAGTPTPPILVIGTETAVASALTQTAAPTSSPLPTNTPTVPPTATDPPPPTPTIPPLNSATPDGTVSPTSLPSVTPIATNTLVPTLPPSATPLIPTNTPVVVVNPTNTPVVVVPTSTLPPVGPTSEPESSVSIADVIVNESAGNVFVILKRANVNSKSVLVNYDTGNGTALAGVDYVAASGQVTWLANDGGDKTIIIQIVNDQVLEPSESFNVLLSNAVGASISDNIGVVTIQDNESGDILINPQSISVSESAGTTSAAITLNGQPQGPVTVNLTSTNPDLCIPAGSVTLDASNWATGVPLSITIVDDFVVSTSGFGNCTIQTSASTSSDANFNNVNPADIDIQVIDNDATYVDQTCPDGDGNTICDDGIRFSTIQSAITNGSIGAGPVLNIIVTTGPHTESGITVNRDVSITGPAGLVIQAAGNVNTAPGRIMTISAGATATLTGISLENGNAAGANGGAILNNGTLTLENVTFQNNFTNGQGGAVSSTGTLTINNGQFNTNNSSSCGGAVHIGPGTTGSVNSTGFTGNQAAAGGAICADGILNLSGGNLSGNIASGNGGAIALNGAGESTLNNAVISNNRGATGGGVFISNASMVVIGGSTLSFNQSTSGSGGAVHTAGDLNVFNITVSGNQSGTGAAGIHQQSGIINLYSATIAFNTSLGGTPSGISGTMTLINTLLDSNTGGDCAGNLNIFNSLISSVPATCIVNENGTVNQLNISAGLSSLGNNGGDTETHLPANPGPAIDTGSPGGGCLGFDQRGTQRPQGAGCDIGSVEQ